MQFYFARLEGEKNGGGEEREKSNQSVVRDPPTRLCRKVYRDFTYYGQQPGSGLEMGVIGRAGSSPSKWPTCNATSIEERRHGANSC